MKYDYVLFDLDGTLTDPAVGITESVIYALEKSGVTPPERESLYKFIGPPLMYSFREYCGMTEEEAARAVGYYRERFSSVGLFENEIYSGVGGAFVAPEKRRNENHPRDLKAGRVFRKNS